MDDAGRHGPHAAVEPASMKTQPTGALTPANPTKAAACSSIPMPMVGRRPIRSETQYCAPYAVNSTAHAAATMRQPC